MIKERTVFVFGAGLSSDYGFPTCFQLRDEIINILKWDERSPSLPEQIKTLERMNFYPEYIIGFREQLENGGFDTIDEFLEKRKNEISRKLGKVAIAMALIGHENPNSFKGRFSNNSFYNFLFKKMVEKTTKETFEENAVSIVTYNYDRSFEFFLWKTLLGHYEDIQESAVDNIMRQIKIIHVHGMLGHMHWQSQSSRDYDSKFDHYNLLLASKGIVNFNDVDSSYIGYTEARKEILKSKNLVFVGFGFHSLNLSRLIEEDCLLGKKRILATAKGIDPERIKEIRDITTGKLNSENMIRTDAVSFCNKYLTWL